MHKSIDNILRLKYNQTSLLRIHWGGTTLINSFGAFWVDSKAHRRLHQIERRKLCRPGQVSASSGLIASSYSHLKFLNLHQRAGGCNSARCGDEAAAASETETEVAVATETQSEAAVASAAETEAAAASDAETEAAAASEAETEAAAASASQTHSCAANHISIVNITAPR